MNPTKHSADVVPATRREFLTQSAALAAATPVLGAAIASAADPQPANPSGKKIRLGLIGCGGRGNWISKLFQAHGGYEFVALADYFPDKTAITGEKLGVDKSRQFHGLSGYKKLLDSGVDAVVIESIPCFFAEQAAAAIEVGVHVYMAKPVAVDVPGAQLVRATGKRATEKKRTFLVDYQMRNDPINREIVSRIHAGGLGRLVHLSSIGFTGGRGDEPRGATIENLFRRGLWTSHSFLGGDTICEYSIHIIDAMLWVAGKTPVAASGAAIRCRPNPHGDRHDAMNVTYEFDDGTLWSHRDQTLSNNEDLVLRGTAHGSLANALITYWGKAFLRGGPKHFGGGSIDDLYDAGAKRNIAQFHDDILQGHCDNPTPAQAADGILTVVLGREAAIRKTRVTMEEIVKENRKLPLDLSGLNV